MIVRTPQEQAAKNFNEDYPVGTLVDYWTMARSGEPKRGKTRTPAQVLSGHTAVVWVEGHSGCIALTHVRPVDA